jgi:hybrid cluster-associated redox disulfide protein
MEQSPAPANDAAKAPLFHADMTVGEAMQLHPRAREVFAGFHLGGCSHCAVSEFETIAQVCQGYGVPVDMLVGSLNSLADMEPTPAK